MTARRWLPFGLLLCLLLVGCTRDRADNGGNSERRGFYGGVSVGPALP